MTKFLIIVLVVFFLVTFQRPEKKKKTRAKSKPLIDVLKPHQQWHIEDMVQIKRNHVAFLSHLIPCEIEKKGNAYLVYSTICNTKQAIRKYSNIDDVISWFTGNERY